MFNWIQRTFYRKNIKLIMRVNKRRDDKWEHEPNVNWFCFHGSHLFFDNEHFIDAAVTKSGNIRCAQIHFNCICFSFSAECIFLFSFSFSFEQLFGDVCVVLKFGSWYSSGGFHFIFIGDRKCDNKIWFDVTYKYILLGDGISWIFAAMWRTSAGARFVCKEVIGYYSLLSI